MHVAKNERKQGSHFPRNWKPTKDSDREMINIHSFNSLVVVPFCNSFGILRAVIQRTVNLVGTWREKTRGGALVLLY